MRGRALKLAVLAAIAAGLGVSACAHHNSLSTGRACPAPTDALQELKQTAVGYRNTYWTTPPQGSHWAKGIALLPQVRRGCPTPVFGVADYYVSATGSDSNPGTQVSPFLTLNKCAQQQTSVAIICGILGTQTFLPQAVGQARTADITFRYEAGANAQIGPWVHLGTTASWTVGSSYTIDLQGGETTVGFPQDIAGNCPDVGVACYKIWVGGGAFQCTGETSTTFTGCKDITAQNGHPSPWSDYAGADIKPAADGLVLSGSHIKTSGLSLTNVVITGNNNTMDGGTFYLWDYEASTVGTISNATELDTHVGGTNQIGASASSVSGLTIDNTKIQGLGSDKCNTGSGAYACHAAGIHVQCLTGPLTITRSVFTRNDVFDIEFQKGAGCASWFGPATLRNNYFDCRWTVSGGDGSGGPMVRSCTGAALNFDTTNTGSGNTVYIFEYNSGYTQTNDTSTSSAPNPFGAGSVFRGNISLDTSLDCTTTLIAVNSCSHNIYNRAGPPGNNADDGTSVYGHSFTGDFTDAANMDLSLTGGAYPLLKGDPANCPTVDIRGITRNAANCDAGAYQRSP